MRGPRVPEEDLPDPDRNTGSSFYKNVGKAALFIGGVLGGGYALGSSGDELEVKDYLEIVEDMTTGYVDTTEIVTEASTHSAEIAQYTTDVLNSL